MAFEGEDEGEDEDEGEGEAKGKSEGEVWGLGLGFVFMKAIVDSSQTPSPHILYPGTIKTQTQSLTGNRLDMDIRPGA